MLSVCVVYTNGIVTVLIAALITRPSSSCFVCNQKEQYDPSREGMIVCVTEGRTVWYKLREGDSWRGGDFLIQGESCSSVPQMKVYS